MAPSRTRYNGMPPLRRMRKVDRQRENGMQDDHLVGPVSGGRKRRALPAVLVLAATGAVLMLSSSNSTMGINGSTYLQRFSRMLSNQAERTIPPEILESIAQLAEPFLDDESNIFAFDKTDPRPVVNTFFAIRDGQSISKEDAETLAVWKQAWSGAGWNPRILSIKHAEAHPDFDGIDAKLKDVPLGPDPFYDRSCYLRHFAMAATGGGWMTDYDTVPYHMDAAIYGKNLPNDGQFTTYEVFVPSVIVGDSAEWDRVASALLAEGVDAGANEDVGFLLKGKPRLFSDMLALKALIEKDEVIVAKPQTAFEAHRWLEIMDWDLDAMGEYLDRGTLLQQSCERSKPVMALHFSHSAVAKSGYLPEDRPGLIAAFLDRWSKLCGGPNFYFADSKPSEGNDRPNEGGAKDGRESVAEGSVSDDNDSDDGDDVADNEDDGDDVGDNEDVGLGGDVGDDNGAVNILRE